MENYEKFINSFILHYSNSDVDFYIDELKNRDPKKAWHILLRSIEYGSSDELMGQAIKEELEYYLCEKQDILLNDILHEIKINKKLRSLMKYIDWTKIEDRVWDRVLNAIDKH